MSLIFDNEELDVLIEEHIKDKDEKVTIKENKQIGIMNQYTEKIANGFNNQRIKGNNDFIKFMISYSIFESEELRIALGKISRELNEYDYKMINRYVYCSSPDELSFIEIIIIGKNYDPKHSFVRKILIHLGFISEY